MESVLSEVFDLTQIENTKTFDQLKSLYIQKQMEVSFACTLVEVCEKNSQTDTKQRLKYFLNNLHNLVEQKKIEILSKQNESFAQLCEYQDAILEIIERTNFLDDNFKNHQSDEIIQDYEYFIKRVGSYCKNVYSCSWYDQIISNSWLQNIQLDNIKQLNSLFSDILNDIDFQIDSYIMFHWDEV